MKLMTSSTSPYGRKVRIVLHLLGLQEGTDYSIENILPNERPTELTQHNALSRIPTLVLEDNSVLIDSQLIVEYLLAQYPHTASQALIPAENAWHIKSLTQLAQGLMDYTVGLILEARRPTEYQFSNWRDLLSNDVHRILQNIEDSYVPKIDEPLNLYSLTLICALDFIDFRQPNLAWQKHYPNLAAWQDALSQQPYLKESYPAA